MTTIGMLRFWTSVFFLVLLSPVLDGLDQTYIRLCSSNAWFLCSALQSINMATSGILRSSDSDLGQRDEKRAPYLRAIIKVAEVGLTLAEKKDSSRPKNFGD